MYQTGLIFVPSSYCNSPSLSPTFQNMLFNSVVQVMLWED